MKKTRGLILIVLTIISILVGGTTVKAADYTVVGNLTSDTTVLQADTTVNVSFNISSIDVGGNAGISAMQATVDYDTSVFEPITANTMSGGNGWSAAYDERLVLVRMSGCTTSTETMVTIPFKIKSEITATETTITLKDITVAGTSGEWSSGNITVEPVSVTLSTSGGSGSGSQGGDPSNPNGPGSGSGSGESGDPGSGSGSGTGSGSGSGTGSGNGSGTGSGNGSGTGSGNGSGTGSGNGSGTGSGNGSGSGSGTGSSDGTGSGNGSGTGSDDGLNSGANGSDGTTSANSIPAAGVNKVVLSAIFVVAVIGAVGYFLYARLKKEIK